MKKILIVTDDRSMGGVSVLLEDILKNVSYKFKIDLMILNNNGKCFENLPENIKIIYGTKFFDIIGIHLKNMIKERRIIQVIKKAYLIFLMKTGLIKYRIKKERKKLNLPKYDVEIAFKDGFTSCFTGYGDAKEKIQWIHSDYSKVDYLKNYKKQYIKLFDLFTKVVAVSDPVKQNFNAIYGQKEKTIVINNLIDTNKIINRSKEDNPKLSDAKTNLITVGRLHKDKNFDGLINVIARLKKDGIFKDMHLSIIGDGDEMQNLVSLVKELKLEKEVTLLGNQINPFKYLKSADLFVLSSKHESFGNVVIEALTLNIPVVATKVATMHEMLDSDYGIIVKNSNEGIYEGLKTVLTDDNKIKKFKENLKKNYKYNNKKIIKDIENLLK